MVTLSTRQAAKKLGIDATTLSRYIRDGKVPIPETVQLGGITVHAWTEKNIERVRKLLPSIPDRRTREHRKQRAKKPKK